ncbi:hypothetical protein EIN_128750 [Entamoeba invadens IP1]|uniref:Uncharacterized protein n=1 Tax=Entamoeba invadens IP1 TaxID=370355 RepID=L7FPH8_ENTIV|nr:hypothetical protein EIN_128750 [Entamoeba invadens IP1]ELP91565.1 hypothetical protein EIN_128750 [Entamoeba invadens IP1]|eukprot:XP_004258336.1 hypothetical protein EIN_128750 [Entamoeba invadens IP1]
MNFFFKMDKSDQKPTMTEMKRESKSFEAIQQGMVFAVLSAFGYSFQIKRPERMAEKTFQYLTIMEVFKDEVALDFGCTIDDFCQRQYETEFDPNMSKGTLKIVKRRKDLNRTALSFSWMLQYCQQSGIDVEKRRTKQARKTLQLEKIVSITLPQSLVFFDKVKIETMGTIVHKHICSLFNKREKNITIPQNYPFFVELLNTNSTTRALQVDADKLSENTISSVQESSSLGHTTSLQKANKVVEPTRFVADKQVPQMVTQPPQMVISDVYTPRTNQFESIQTVAQTPRIQHFAPVNVEIQNNQVNAFGYETVYSPPEAYNADPNFVGIGISSEDLNNIKEMNLMMGCYEQPMTMKSTIPSNQMYLRRFADQYQPVQSGVFCPVLMPNIECGYF